MVFTNSPQLRIRGLDPVRSSWIGLGAVALAIIITVVLWSYVWPAIRKRFVNKYFPARTRFRDEHYIPHPIRNQLWPWKKEAMFPTHPALLRDSVSQRLEPRLPIYHPNIPSSFCNQPEYDETIDMSALPPRHRLASDLDTSPASHELLTTAKKRFSSMIRRSLRKSKTTPWTREEYERARSLTSEHDFGDAKEYILAIPEPLVLRSRSPVPDRISATTSEAFGTSMLNNTTSPFAEHSAIPTHRANVSSYEVHNSSRAKITDHTEAESCTSYVSEVSTFGEDDHHKEDDDDKAKGKVRLSDNTCSLADLSESESEKGNKSIAALNRLKSYRSLTGARPIRPLTRAGTLTRPKTPVAEIRNLYGGATSHRNLTPGTACYTEASSVMNHSSTTGDSHRAPSTVRTSFDITASSHNLLPTPLNIVLHSPTDKTQSGSIKDDISQFSPKHCSGALDASSSDRITAAEVVHQAPKRDAANTKSRSMTQHMQLQSSIPVTTRRSRLVKPVTSRSSMQSPLIVKRPIRGSSIYSRDTKGISVGRSSMSPSFERTVDRTHEICTPFQGGEDEDAHSSNTSKGGLSQDTARISSNTDTKSDGWQHIMQTEAWGKLPSRLRNAVSNRESAHSSSDQTTKCENRSETSTISTELNSVDAEAVRESVPRLCIRESTGGMANSNGNLYIEAMPSNDDFGPVCSTSQAVLQSKGSAPGGAYWL